MEDIESYFDKESSGVKENKKLELAEKERVKGNEALKSKDYDEAIQYYTKSIGFDPRMYQSLGNRAFVYLKKKCKFLLSYGRISKVSE